MTKRTGFSLVEVLISTLLVGVLLVSALRSVGAVVRHRNAFDERTQAFALANGLISEILEKSYEDPESPGGIGIESGEDLTQRNTFDDVDDYAGWTSQPPVDRLGAAMPNAGAFRRSVSVMSVSPTDVSQQVANDQGMKRIRVTVSVNNVEFAAIDVLRTQANDEMRVQ